ncbi:MAG: glycosyltransferase [Nodosilinea sp.]
MILAKFDGYYTFSKALNSRSLLFVNQPLLVFVKDLFVKIAIISHSHYPIKEPFAGGLEAHTSSLTRQLQQAGHHVTLYSAVGTDEALPFIPSFRPTAVGLFNSKGNIADYREERYLALMQLLQKSDYDVVHNNSLHYIPLKMASSLPMPMVTVLHTPPFPSLATGFRASLAAKNHRVIGVSKAVMRAWQRAVPELTPTLVYNGVDTHVWLPLRQQKKHAIWFGRVAPEKGTHLAIKASIQASVPLKICGPIHDSKYFAEQVKPWLGGNVTYLGSLNAVTLANEVAQASVFVCTPCWDEPFGLVAAEALASGTPVAGFRRGALSEILTPETGVLVAKNNVDELARAIPQAQQLCRQACRRRATELFSVDAMIRNYTRLYRQLVRDRLPISAL